jgi:hypothetical protein
VSRESLDSGNAVDVVAHGLWGGTAFCRSGKSRYITALLLGMAPDLLSFGIFHLTRPSWIMLRLAGELSGPPPLSILPEYVFYTYNLTHSFVVWSAVFVLIWTVKGNPPWLLAAWSLHIVCDIPTHAASYFPTPYLWPFPTPLVDGISWAAPWFMVTNYLSLATVYTVIFLYSWNLGRLTDKNNQERKNF